MSVFDKFRSISSDYIGVSVDRKSFIMKKSNLISLTIILLIGAIIVGFAYSDTNKRPSKEVLIPENTVILSDDPFDKMMAVLTHKRCVNCHPSSDHPRQGEDSHVHNFGVQRGPEIME